MNKSTKELLFERMHTIGGMPLKENDEAIAIKLASNYWKKYSNSGNVDDIFVIADTIKNKENAENWLNNEFVEYFGISTYVKRIMKTQIFQKNKAPNPEEWKKSINDWINNGGYGVYGEDGLYPIEEVKVKPYVLTKEIKKFLSDYINLSNQK